MSEPICVRCGRPTPDGYVCTAETAKAAAQLAEIVDMAPAARDVAYRLSANLSGSGGAGKPGSRLPLDLPSLARYDGVKTALTRWVDRIGPERGITRPWFTQDGDPIAVAADWLTDHTEWIRHQPDREPDDKGNTWGADQFLTDVDAAVRVLRSVTRGAQEQRYLGPCGAWIQTSEHPVDADDLRTGGTLATCDGDVYGRAGGDKGTCRTCGACVDQGERLIWLDDVRRDWLFTAKDIADAYQLNVKTIRSWHNRGQLAAHGHDPDGAALHKIGEVLDLAAGDAARREEARATRARRTAARAAESETAA